MKLTSSTIAFVLFCLIPLAARAEQRATGKPPVPRIDYVVPLPQQPHATDSSTIWYDDFNGPEKKYAEGKSPLDERVSFGGEGKSLRLLYEKGSRGVGGRKLFFGDTPTYSRSAPRRGESFDEVYWRIYVKHQPGWKGAPAKMSRATVMASEKWTQAMIAHVWSGRGDSLTLDPASGVRGGQVVTRKYNDFERLKWLGNRPASRFPIHATSESGYWVLVESRAKLNTPGKSDGINQLWIDGRLECERRNLNWRGSYTKHGINAVFLEAYWNQGSPVTQSRWYDNFVVSTRPIGPVVCSPNPQIVKTPFRGTGQAGNWEFEVAADFDGSEIVFRSKRLPPNPRAAINAQHGRFVASHRDLNSLRGDATYYIRVRQADESGTFSAWSRWHQGFAVR